MSEGNVTLQPPTFQAARIWAFSPNTVPTTLCSTGLWMPLSVENRSHCLSTARLSKADPKRVATEPAGHGMS